MGPVRRGRHGSRRLERVGQVRGGLERSYPLDLSLPVSMSMTRALMVASFLSWGRLVWVAWVRAFARLSGARSSLSLVQVLDNCGSALSLGYPWSWLILGPEEYLSAEVDLY